MAKIEMDISEYEVMKENKRLLEKSLEKERELKEQVDKLNKEKLEVLENSQRKVVKIVKNQVSEFLVKKRGDYDLIVSDFLKLLDIFKSSSHKRHLFYDTFPDQIKLLQDNLFEVVKKESEPTVDTTMYGLDDIKEEIRSEYYDKMTEEIREKLNKAQIVFNRNLELDNENKELSIKVSSLERSVDSLEDKKTELLSEVENLEKSLSEYVENSNKYKTIASLMSGNYGFFKRSVLKEINKIVKS